MIASADIRLYVGDDNKMRVASAPLTLYGWDLDGTRTRKGRENIKGLEARLDLVCRIIDRWDELEPAVRLSLQAQGQDDVAILGPYGGGH